MQASSSARDPLTLERLRATIEEAGALLTRDPARTADLARQTLAQAEALHDSEAYALSLTLLGISAFSQSDYPAAKSWLQTGLEYSRAHGHAAAEARCVNALGSTHHKLGDYASSMACFLEGLELAQAQDNVHAEVMLLSNIALLHWSLSEYAEALELHDRALELARRIGHARFEATIEMNRLVDHAHLGRHESVLLAAPTVRERLVALGLRQPEGVLLAYLALTLLDTGREAEALRICDEALGVLEPLGDREYQAFTLTTRGRAALRLGDTEAAVTDLQRAEWIAADIGAGARSRDAHRFLADAYEARGGYREALRHHRAYHELERTLHAEEVDRRTKVLGMQAQLVRLRREAEVERQRNDLLAYQATHDFLTGLPNRSRLEAELREALATGEPLALAFVDLDGFKAVNDTHGHEVGDALLREVAERLRRAVGPADLAARLGGDEFIVLLRGTVDTNVPDRLRTVLEGDYRLGSVLVTVGASVGVAVAPRDGTDVLSLQRHADAAMYRAKRARRSRSA